MPAAPGTKAVKSAATRTGAWILMPLRLAWTSSSLPRTMPPIMPRPQWMKPSPPATTLPRMMTCARLRGRPASRARTRLAGGEVATAVPVASSTTICIVNSSRFQNAPVQAPTSETASGSPDQTGVSVKMAASTATSSVRARQMTNESGIQRTNQAR